MKDPLVDEHGNCEDCRLEGCMTPANHELHGRVWALGEAAALCAALYAGNDGAEAKRNSPAYYRGRAADSLRTSLLALLEQTQKEMEKAP